MTYTYMDHTHPDAFKHLPKLSPPSYYPNAKHECAKCQGHGGWHLRLDAYGEGKHFNASCSNCDGWGYVERDDGHIHQWGNEKNVGRCLHEWTCLTCNQKRVIDSSD
jgi:hypothetical protein